MSNTNPTPEERERMVADALAGSRLLKDLELTPEERLLAKLEEVNKVARNAFQVAVVKFPFHQTQREHRSRVQEEVQHAYFTQLDRFEKHEIQNLLSAFLTSHLINT